MEHLKGSPYISIDDIIIINKYQQDEAWTHLLETKKYMGLHFNNKVTVSKYCAFYGINYHTVVACINPYRTDSEDLFVPGIPD